MCGIAGFQGTHDPRLAQEMCDAVAHRGPDGEGTLVIAEDGGTLRTGFAHRRLAIIDTSSAGKQPMWIDCPVCGAHSLSDLAMTYNGEIYNYRELRADLRLRGHIFRTATDSEIIMHMYGEQGPAALGKLNGIFAFALREGRATARGDRMRRGDVLLARDQMGVKPLYVAETASGTAFASEIKAILRDPSISRELNHEAIHYMLAYLWMPSPHTALKAVRRIEPGAALILREGRLLREWRYYDLPAAAEPLEGRFDDISALVEKALDTAVDRQMMSDVPVGAFLSGGLDSSAIVASMRKTHPSVDPLCYCIGFAGDRGFDGAPADVPYARRVAAHLGVRLREIVIGASVAQHLDRTIWALDDPQADPAPMNALLIAEQARKDGIPVLLGGTGGDDIFSGYRRHYALKLERAWGWLPRLARSGIASVAHAARTGRSHWVRRASRAFAYADLPRDERMVSYFWWSGEAMRRSLYTHRLSTQLRDVQTAGPLLETLRHIGGVRDPLQRMLYLEARHFLSDHNLGYTDKMGMAAGVEVRVPFLDLDLVALAARIPTAMKQRGRTGKAVLKRAMESRLPRDVIYRPKSGFGMPLRDWLRGDLRQRVDDTLSRESLAQRGLFEPAAVSRLIELDRAGSVDGSYTIFALLSLELWCRMYVDPTTPIAPAGVR